MRGSWMVRSSTADSFLWVIGGRSPELQRGPGAGPESVPDAVREVEDPAEQSRAGQDLAEHRRGEAGTADHPPGDGAEPKARQVTAPPQALIALQRLALEGPQASAFHRGEQRRPRPERAADSL